MINDASFQRLAAVTSILATLLALSSIGFQASVLLTIPSGSLAKSCPV